MNRHNLATIIRDFLVKNTDVDTVEAAIDKTGGVVKVRFYRRYKLVAEVLRLMACLSLASCGFITGIDEYSPARADIRDGAADSANPPGEGGAMDAAGGEADSNTMADGGLDAAPDAAVDAAPEADAAVCATPPAFDCGGGSANPTAQVCVHNNANGADNVIATATPCATCETYTCACLLANGPSFTGCGANAEGGITAEVN